MYPVLCFLVAKKLSFLMFVVQILMEFPEEGAGDDDWSDDEDEKDGDEAAHQSGANKTSQANRPWFELNPAVC